MLELLPSSIDAAASAMLVGVCLVGAFITGAMGIGGGIMVLAAMATLMPAPAIIPVHGTVMLSANLSRASFQFPHIDWRTFAYFAAGSVAGIALGGSVVVTLPADVLRTGLAFFILYTVWGPKMRIVSEGSLVVTAIGFVASFLTMFFGATGAFISGLLSQRGYSPRALVATHAACMGTQHILKILAFGLLGFAFADWLGLIAAMVAVTVLGSYLGTLVLNRLPAEIFARGLKAILTLLALNLLATVLGLYRLV